MCKYANVQMLNHKGHKGFRKEHKEEFADVQMSLLPLRSLYSLRPLRENLTTEIAKIFAKDAKG